MYLGTFIEAAVWLGEEFCVVLFWWEMVNLGFAGLIDPFVFLARVTGK